MKLNLRLFLVFSFAMFFGFLSASLNVLSNDYETYNHLYTHYNNAYDFLRMEPMFKFFIYAFNFLDFNFYFFWFFLSFMSLYIKFFIFEKTSCSLFILIILVLLYASSLLLLHEVTQIRAALAAAFGFLFVFFICKNERLYAAICLLTACSFHYSALLFPSVLICRNGNKKITMLGLVCIMSLLVITPVVLEDSIFFLDKLNPLFRYYYSNSEDVAVNPLSVTTILASMFGVLNLVIIKMYKFERYYRMLSLLNLLGLAMLIIFSFSPVLSVRMYELFSLTAFILVGLLFGQGNTEKSKVGYICMKYLLFILLCCISVHRYISYVFVNPIIAL